VIEIFISERRREISTFSLSEYPFRRNIRDKNLLQKFDLIDQSRKETRTLRDVLAKIAGKDSWGRDDEEILSTANIKDYYTVFKTEQGPHLSSWVDTCLQFGRFSNPSEKMLKIAENATAALRMIGNESVLNSLRVRKYGIQLNLEEPERKV
jgi:hypothetical protein